MNPFSGNAPATQETGSVAIEAQRAIAEVQAAILLAKQFPRDKQRAIDNILNDCRRLSLAKQAIYSYPRGKDKNGKNLMVTGPTIRLAEAIALEWGNLQFGWHEVSRSNNKSETNSSEIEAWAWDMEKNIRSSMKFVVKHFRDTKGGGYALKDERDIYELCANNASRRLRQCLLRLFPGDIIELAERQCKKTLNDNYKVTPENIKEMIEVFEPYHVTKEHIEGRMERRIESITSQQMVGLQNIYTSLKNGMSVASDWFKMKNDQPAMSNAERIKANRTHAVRREAKPTPAEETPACDPATGEVVTDVTPPKIEDIIIIELPDGSAPPRMACSSVKDAAEAMAKEIGDRYQKGNQEEIDWIMKNNTELLVRIQHEQPEEYKNIQDLSDMKEDGGMI